MHAIVNADGRQRRVKRGDIVWFEKKNVEVGETVTFDNVLLLSDGVTTHIGTPTVEGAAVEVKILRQGRDRKIVIYKYKRRKGYARKKGHRQPFTEARVTDILLNGESVVADKAASDEAVVVEEAPVVEAVPEEAVAPVEEIVEETPIAEEVVVEEAPDGEAASDEAAEEEKQGE